VFREKHPMSFFLGETGIRVSIAVLVIVFACSSSLAQTVHPFAQQWTDKRVEREAIFSQICQIASKEYNGQRAYAIYSKSMRRSKRPRDHSADSTAVG
jgi:hypothetical protein